MKSILWRVVILAASVLPQLCWAGDSLRLGSIEVREFLGKTGELSDPLSERRALWNELIASTETFVDVTVRGKPGAYVPNRKVNLTVAKVDGGKRLASFSSSVGVLSDTGEYHVGFLILGTGCDALRLVATLEGSTEHIESTVDYSCGE
jgi:hypothetical protein